MNVKYYRNKKGLTQREMAEKLSLSLKGYIKKETGERGFKVKELLLLEDILEVSISELFADIKQEIKEGR